MEEDNNYYGNQSYYGTLVEAKPKRKIGEDMGYELIRRLLDEASHKLLSENTKRWLLFEKNFTAQIDSLKKLIERKK